MGPWRAVWLERRRGILIHRAELRADVFNALNTVDINGRNTTAQFTSPTNLTSLADTASPSVSGVSDAEGTRPL